MTVVTTLVTCRIDHAWMRVRWRLMPGGEFVLGQDAVRLMIG
jgi:hypothetical protein